MIRLVTLGVPGCFVDDVELAELPAQRSRFALLTYLALEQNVSRDDAATMFWPERGDDRARHALSQSVYELKRLLGDAWLNTQGGRLVVTSELSVDAHQFSSFLEQGQYEHAVNLYRGPFLSGFYLPNCKAFETWVDKKRAHYERAHRKGRRESINALIEAKRTSEALISLRRWVELDPFDDEANHRLIEVLALAGNRTDALREYAGYEARLKEELSVEPLDHTRQLVESIRSESSISNPPSTLKVITIDANSPASTQTVAGVRRFLAPRYTIPAVIALALIIVLRIAAFTDNVNGLSLPEPLDTTRFAILPFEYDDNVKTRINEESMLREALTRWGGVSVVDEFLLNESLARTSEQTRASEVLTMVRMLGAGRYIRGRVSLLADSLRVYAVMFDANRQGTAIADRTVKIPISMASADSAFGYLADALLFHDEMNVKSGDVSLATRSWPARRAFTQAQRALRDWDLVRADAQFAEALRNDADYAQAHLWLAQVRSWLKAPVSEWNYAAERAIATRSQLSQRDQVLAEALLALSRGEAVMACKKYQQLAQNEPRDFAAWYGWADCLQRDRTVVADPNSPSGLSFRTGYHTAVGAYRRAFELLPSVHRALRANGFERLRVLLKTNHTMPRAGSKPGSADVDYVAYPQLAADTLAFVPYTYKEFEKLVPPQAQVNAAIQHQRRIFREIASAWVLAYPNSYEAVEAVAVGLELLGNRAALDTLIKARQLATSDSERVRLGAQEVILRLKVALPDNIKAARTARALADSLLHAQPPAETAQPMLMAALAVLTGRATLALEYARSNRAIALAKMPQVVTPAAMPLLIFAAVGGPRDSLAYYERRLNELIEAGLADVDKERVRLDQMRRMSYLALPVYRFNYLANAAPDDVILQATDALRSDNRREAVALLGSEHVKRTMLPGAERSLDVLYPEAWLLFKSNSPQLAANWLDETLTTMHAWPPMFRMAEVLEIGAFVRLMVLRADVAEQLNDRATAGLWARAVLALWADADHFLSPTLQRMRRYAKYN